MWSVGAFMSQWSHFVSRTHISPETPHGNNGLSIPGGRGDRHSLAISPASPPEPACHGIALAVGYNRGQEARHPPGRLVAPQGVIQNGMGNALASVITACDHAASVKGRYMRHLMCGWNQEGTPVRRSRRSWLTLLCTLGLMLSGGAAALACLSHPASHMGTHPLVCIDPGNPVVQAESSPVLLADGRKLRSPAKILTVAVHPAALGTCIASMLHVPAYELSWLQEGTPSLLPASFQPVLRL